MISRGCVKFESAEIAYLYHADMIQKWGDRTNGGVHGLAVDGCYVALDTLGSDDDVGGLLHEHASHWASEHNAGHVERVRVGMQSDRMSFWVRLIE